MIINMLLATGPFSYPYVFVKGGIIFAPILMVVTLFFAYITATFMIEIISISSAQRYEDNRGTMYPLLSGEDPASKRERDAPDQGEKDSPFYIRQKLEFGALAADHSHKYFRYAVFAVLIIYVYGAMLLKYVAGAKSFAEGMSMTIYGNTDTLKEKLFIDPYYLGIIIFGVLSTFFSLGNIENSKGIQMVSTVLRFISIILLIGTSIFVMFKYGVANPAKLDFLNFDEISGLFGGTVFVFICHYSISGIVYPIRPQKKVKPMIITAFMLSSTVLLIEGFCAALAFGHHTSQDPNVFPGAIKPLYNENFLSVPGIG